MRREQRGLGNGRELGRSCPGRAMVRPKAPDHQNQGGCRENERPSPSVGLWGIRDSSRRLHTHENGTSGRGRCFGDLGRMDRGHGSLSRDDLARCQLDRGDMCRSNPAVASALYSFDEYRVIGGVAEGVPQTIDGAADAVVEVDKYALWPQSPAELVTAEHFVGMVEQETESPKREILNPDLSAALAEFARRHVGLEDAEANYGIWLSGRMHNTSRSRGE